MHFKDMDVFILAGQSNMAGRGGVERGTDGKSVFQNSLSSSEAARAGTMLAFDPLSGWQPAIEPIHQKVDNSKICGYGPGPFFGEQLLSRGLSQAVGLVPCAVGGTSIDEWATNGELFQQMVRLTQAALKSIENAQLKGLLWYQGESDCSSTEQAEAWPAKFVALVHALRSSLANHCKMAALPVIMVCISCNSDKAPFCACLRQQQHSLQLEEVYKTDAAGLELQGDGMHLTTGAQQRLGVQLADVYHAIRVTCNTTR